MTENPTRKIFFSYRRADHPDFVERVRDWFALRYGRDSVFMDFDTIPPFTQFVDYIRDKVRECDVLVAFIGPQWLELLNNQKDGNDYVRMEIRLALEEGKPIAPVCIKGARAPHSKALPDDIRTMLDYNVAYLDSGRHFLDNIEPILDALERELTKLDALKVIAKVQNVEFDVFAAIQNYQEAADRYDWRVALDLLGKIRSSGYVPAFYPLDDYEQQAREALRLQEAERDYNIIRMMAARAQSGKEDRARIWSALQTFWQAHPAYDPDDLVSGFRPTDQTAEVSSASVSIEPLSPKARKRSFDPDFLDQLDNPINPVLVDAVFNLDTLAQIAENLPHDDQSISYEQAQSLGLLPNLETQ